MLFVFERKRILDEKADFSSESWRPTRRNSLQRNAFFKSHSINKHFKTVKYIETDFQKYNELIFGK